MQESTFVGVPGFTESELELLLSVSSSSDFRLTLFVNELLFESLEVPVRVDVVERQDDDNVMFGDRVVGKRESKKVKKSKKKVENAEKCYKN